MNNSTTCFFSGAMAAYATPATPYIVGAIDIVNPSTGRGFYGNKSLDDIKQQYPDATIVTFEEAERRREEAVIKGPWRITMERFEGLKGELPPCKWVRFDSEESFHVSERLTGSVVMWLVRLGDDYFELNDRCSLNHTEVVMRCAVWLDQVERASTTH